MQASLHFSRGRVPRLRVSCLATETTRCRSSGTLTPPRAGKSVLLCFVPSADCGFVAISGAFPLPRSKLIPDHGSHMHPSASIRIDNACCMAERVFNSFNILFGVADSIVNTHAEPMLPHHPHHAYLGTF